MAKRSEFVDYLLEGITGVGQVRARAMFGGFGIYLNDLMFGLVADEELYLKTDAQIDRYFDELNLPHFQYEKNGKPYRMSYRRAPESVLDDPEELTEWALRSYHAALRAK